METIKIKELTTLTDLDDEDYLVVDTLLGTFKITKHAFAQFIKPSEIGLGNVFDLKGSKETKEDLPETGNKIGDVWYVEDESVGYVWIKDVEEVERWEQLGLPIDLSNYVTNTELSTALLNYVTNTALSTILLDYVLNTQKASSDELGLIMVGEHLSIDQDGKLSSSVDQTYNKTSENAQSGVAVQQVIDKVGTVSMYDDDVWETVETGVISITKNLQGITASSNPIMYPLIENSSSKENIETLWNRIFKVETGNGTITFYAVDDSSTLVDYDILVKGY